MNNWDKNVDISDRLPKSKLDPNDTCDFHKTQYASLY